MHIVYYDKNSHLVFDEELIPVGANAFNPEENKMFILKDDKGLAQVGEVNTTTEEEEPEIIPPVVEEEEETTEPQPEETPSEEPEEEA
jgi:hypothetical protein